MRKVRTFYLSVAMFLCATVIVLIFGSFNLKTTYAEEVNETDYFNRVEVSINQNQQVLNYFSYSPLSRAQTEDVFSGTYIDDDGYLNVCITKEEKVPTLTSFDAQKIVYQVKPFTYSYLRSIYDFLSDKMEYFAINSLTIFQKDNCVEIGVLEEDYKAEISRELKKLGYDIESVRFVTEDKITLNAVKNVYSGETISKGWIPVRQGTITCPARRNSDGKVGLVTNHHVAKVGETMYAHMKKIGRTAIGKNDGNIDASFIPFDKPTEWNYHIGTAYDVINKAEHDVVKYGGNSRIVENVRIKKAGMVTGITDGKVLAVDYTAYVEFSEGKKVISDCFKYSNESKSGDSGSPVYAFYGTKSAYYLVGIHFAASQSDTNPFGVGCRTDNVQEQLGITFLTF